MKTNSIKNLSAVILATAALWGCNSNASEAEAAATNQSYATIDPSDAADNQLISYGIGHQIGTQVAADLGDALDVDLIAQGVADAKAGLDPQVPMEAFAAAIERLNEERMAEQQAMETELRAEGEAYLAANAEQEGVVITESGLQYQVLHRSESGVSPSAMDQVRVHYTGTLINGDVFDSSVERGQPAEFGLQQVIPGWTEALQLMEAGDKFRIVLPADLAYGEMSPSPMIPPYSVLVFEVELLAVL